MTGFKLIFVRLGMDLAKHVSNLLRPNLLRPFYPPFPTGNQTDWGSSFHLFIYQCQRARCSSVVNPLSYFSFQPVLHDWYIKVCGVCSPVCGIVHIKEPLLLIGKTSPCGGSGFPHAIRMVLYSNHKIKCVEFVVK